MIQQVTYYISTGDDTNPFDSDGYAPIDERTGRQAWDAQRTSANTQDLRGKILRITPQLDGSYTIPDGNLFSDTEEGRPEIYIMGCRNPFRISLDSQTGYLYWGDVGPDAGLTTSQRGPMGHDEINQAKEAGFFGWPYFVADNKAYTDYQFDTQTSGASFNAQNPSNASVNNTGASSLPAAQGALIWYPYGLSTEFPLLGDGGRNAMAGPLFRVEDYPESDARFPAYFDGKLFIYDWMRGWIMSVSLDSVGNYLSMEPFLPSMTFTRPIDMEMGPAGDMFLLEYGTNWFTQNADARLVHIHYQPQTVSTPSDLAQSIDLQVFPNPVRETLYIQAKEPIRQMELHTVEGKQVFYRQMNTREAQFRSTMLSPGMYVLKLQFDKGHVIKRIMWE